MVQIEGVGVPVGFLLSDGKDQLVYKTFVQQLEELTHHHWQPEAVYCDFELAIRNAFRQAFPRCAVLGDAFHFFHDNLRSGVARR
jgi:hypothetical protein